jgi:hypothetical protein
MSYWYPQCSVELRILPEDFKLTSDASLQSPVRVKVVARDVTVNVNDYKSSDTFSMEIDYKNFPFDPRTIRSCGVVIYLQDMQSLYKSDGSLNTIVPGAGTKLDSKVPNAVFIGFVDEEEIEFDDSKRTVKLTGRDSTALLIDQKYQTNSPIALNQPLDVAITTLLSTFKATAAIAVVNKTGGVLPTLAQYYPDFGSPLAGQKNVGKHESYWEIIQDMVSRSGLICFMSRAIQADGTLVPALVLTTPKNQATNTDDIKFIYGINIKSMHFKRKLGRFKGFNVQVRSRVGKTVLIAKIPEEATQAWADSFGIQKIAQVVPVLKPDGSLDTSTQQPAPYITFNVPNIADKDQLIRIGQTFYEQYSLQQLEGNFETHEMLGRGGTRASGLDAKKNYKQYDLTQIAKGQTICLEIDSDDLSEISRLASFNDRVNYLVHRNYSKDVATIFAKTMGKFSPRFQIKSYSMTLNQDSGFKLDIHFQNIIDISHRGIT